VIPEGTRDQGFEDSSEMLKNYKDLKVWQKSYKLCLEIYRITANFPKEERYGLTNKVRLCERSEPQSEPFVGQARWQVNDKFKQVKLNLIRLKRGCDLLA